MPQLRTFHDGELISEEDIDTGIVGPPARTRDQVRAAIKAVSAPKYAAAMTDARLSYFLTRLAMTPAFTKDSSELLEGLDTMVSLGLWTVADKNAFLAGWS